LIFVFRDSGRDTLVILSGEGLAYLSRCWNCQFAGDLSGVDGMWM
jgi:hypothetical protein